MGKVILATAVALAIATPAMAEPITTLGCVSPQGESETHSFIMELDHTSGDYGSVVMNIGGDVGALRFRMAHFGPTAITFDDHGMTGSLDRRDGTLVMHGDSTVYMTCTVMQPPARKF